MKLIEFIPGEFEVDTISPNAFVKHIDSYPTSTALLRNFEMDIFNIYQHLNLKNEAILQIAFDVISHCRKIGKNDINISYTGDNELLIYRNVDSELRNIIIDENADVEFLVIPVNRRNTFNEHHPFILPINAGQLAEKL